MKTIRGNGKSSFYIFKNQKRWCALEKYARQTSTQKRKGHTAIKGQTLKRRKTLKAGSLTLIQVRVPHTFFRPLLGGGGGDDVLLSTKLGGAKLH